jgi:hypothetical protein
MYLHFGDFSMGTISLRSDFAGEAATRLWREQTVQKQKQKLC